MSDLTEWMHDLDISVPTVTEAISRSAAAYDSIFGGGVTGVPQAPEPAVIGPAVPPAPTSNAGLLVVVVVVVAILLFSR